MDKQIYEAGAGANHLQVIRTVNLWSGHQVIELRLGRQRAAAIQVEDGKPAYRYMQQFMLGAALHPDAKRVLILGGGVGVVAAALHAALPEAVIEVVEPDERLQALGERYFQVPQDERIRWHTTTAEAYMATDSGPRYDLIFIDVFTPDTSHIDGGEIPASVQDLQFMRKVASRLLQKGMILQNVIGVWSEQSNLVRQIALNYRKSGLQVYPCLMVQATKPGLEQNIVLVADEDPIPLKKRLLTKGLTEFASVVF